ncbi:sugar ABC transporter permease [Enterocloster sp. OA13]|uniref:carbohydrate ABC transporter permease n=1 Tax=Enterocloster TaxID=2719313 RepID=UPI0004710220|nr:sugar ABC transporter permease [Lachnoclostridium pacaense]MCH1951439.1 sugar ABC transporter permease [Enterocloster sp. OA13]RJW54172.1 sugar ABC transporter permease [Clostridiales bacterium TF09-2AC]
MERGRRKRKKVRGEAVLLALPALLVYSCVIIYPIFNMLATSFFEWNGVPDSPRQFVRLANYQNFFTDYAAAYAIKNIAILMAAGLFCTIPIAFFLATVINRTFCGKRLFRVVYFMPVLINRVAIGLMFTFLCFPKIGPVPAILNHLRIAENVNLLGNINTAMWTVAFVHVWCDVGFQMILLSAGMAALPTDVYEAAVIDGVTPWEKLRYITLPMMKGTLKISVILVLTGSFKVFDLLMSLTGGGPGNATQLPSTLLYTAAFSHSKFGYANAIAVMTVVFCLLITIVVNALFREKKEGRLI